MMGTGSDSGSGSGRGASSEGVVVVADGELTLGVGEALLVTKRANKGLWMVSVTGIWIVVKPLAEPLG